jgi:hypothetical protein
LAINTKSRNTRSAILKNEFFPLSNKDTLIITSTINPMKKIENPFANRSALSSSGLTVPTMPPSPTRVIIVDINKSPGVDKARFFNDFIGYCLNLGWKFSFAA